MEYKTMSPLPNDRYKATVANNKDKIVNQKVDENLNKKKDEKKIVQKFYCYWGLCYSFSL